MCCLASWRRDSESEVEIAGPAANSSSRDVKGGLNPQYSEV